MRIMPRYTYCHLFNVEHRGLSFIGASSYQDMAIPAIIVHFEVVVTE